MRFDIKEDGKRILMVCVASLIMALNIKTFVRTGGLYPGGATGLTILIQRVADLFFGITIPYTLVNVILNAIPVYIGFRFIGKKFTLYSCLMILLTGILTDLIHDIHTLGHSSETGVLTVQVGTVALYNEKLGAGAVHILGTGHGDRSSHMGNVIFHTVAGKFALDGLI